MKVKRFSYYNNLQGGLDKKVNEGLNFANDVSTQLLENDYLGKTRGVKRWGQMVKDSVKLIRKKKKEKNYSSPDEPRRDTNIKIDTGEKAKFEAALDRMTGGELKKFSEREKVPQDILEKAKKEGVIQKDHNGDWRIVAIKKGEFWVPSYSSKEKARAALSGYFANKKYSNNQTEEENQNPVQPQLTSQELQIERMRMQRELLRTHRLQQELAAKERQDAIRNQMKAQKDAAEEKDSDEKNTLRAQKAVQGSQENQPNTGVYKKATLAKAPVSMK